MYHPTRGGVRGGRDQFKWDDVKVDKHRENYLGHSLKAPVGRWQKGKDLNWYARGKSSLDVDTEEAKAEIKRIKEEEELAMQEALGLAPKRYGRPQGNRLDKHEFQELVKRGSTAEDLGAGHAEAAHVQGLGFARAPRSGGMEESTSLPTSQRGNASPERVNAVLPKPQVQNTKEESSDDESSRKKRKREDRRHEKHGDKRHEKREERRHEKHGDKRHEKRHSRDSDDKRKHRRDKEKRRHDSD